MCFDTIHPLPWRLRQSSQMTLFKDHPNSYSRSTGPNEHLDEDNPTGSRPSLQKPTMSTKIGAATILINNFIPHPKLFSETEGFLIVGASFIEISFCDPPVLKPQTQTSLLFPFP